MPTNKERKEIAARLRTVPPELLQLVFIEKILSGLIGGVTVTEEGEVDELLVIRRLADLINPEPEPEQSCETCEQMGNPDSFISHLLIMQCPYYDAKRHYCNVHSREVPERTCYCVNEDEQDVCSECGESWEYAQNYCPNCGAKVVEK